LIALMVTQFQGPTRHFTTVHAQRSKHQFNNNYVSITMLIFI